VEWLQLFIDFALAGKKLGQSLNMHFGILQQNKERCIMNRRGNVELIIFGLVAVIALVGLVLLFSGKLTGKAAGQPMIRQVLVNPEPFRIERPGGYACGCMGVCAYTGKTERVQAPIASSESESEAACRTQLEYRCGGPVNNFRFGCGTR